jgi:hypothetical protein
MFELQRLATSAIPAALAKAEHVSGRYLQWYSASRSSVREAQTE